MGEQGTGGGAPRADAWAVEGDPVFYPPGFDVTGVEGHVVIPSAALPILSRGKRFPGRV